MDHANIFEPTKPREHIPSNASDLCLCPICKGEEGETCKCVQALSAYFQLLLSAEGRCVSTQKVTSNMVVGTAGSACIDKLSFSLDQPVSRLELISRAERVPLPLTSIKLRDQRWYFEVGGDDVGWYFRLGHCEAERISRVVTRPSAFPTFSSYIRNLCRLLTMQELQDPTITRLDFAVDYAESFTRILRCLDVLHKKVRVQYLDEGSARTGLLVGKSPEKLLVYDKARRLGLDEACTRVEIQLSGKKLPRKRLFSLPELVRNASHPFCPFKSVRLHDVQLCDPSRLLTGKARSRHEELRILLEREGYLGARKKLNESGNFQRDYGPLIDVAAWTETPDEILNRHLKAFFDGLVSESI